MSTTNNTNASDKIQRALRRIASIRQNLPQKKFVEEQFVQEYTDALQHLEGLGYDTEEFKIPQTWLQKEIVQTQLGLGRSRDRLIDRALFLTKIDAVLGYFTQAKEPIGFAGPRARD